MPDWQYDEPSRRYRDTAGGRYVSASSERAIRDDFVQRKQADIAALAAGWPAAHGRATGNGRCSAPSGAPRHAV
jgi:hypothetical protein